MLGSQQVWSWLSVFRQVTLRSGRAWLQIASLALQFGRLPLLHQFLHQGFYWHAFPHRCRHIRLHHCHWLLMAYWCVPRMKWSRAGDFFLIQVMKWGQTLHLKNHWELMTYRGWFGSAVNITCYCHMDALLFRDLPCRWRWSRWASAWRSLQPGGRGKVLCRSSDTAYSDSCVDIKLPGPFCGPCPTYTLTGSRFVFLLLFHWMLSPEKSSLLGDITHYGCV